MVTNLTSVPTAPVSFAGTSRLWGPELRETEDKSFSCSSRHWTPWVWRDRCAHLPVVCLVRDFTQQPDMECIHRLFSRQLEQWVTEQSSVMVDKRPGTLNT